MDLYDFNKIKNISGNLPDEKPKVDLSNIEEVILPNGLHFIKYVDPKTNEMLMLKYDNSNLSYTELFDNIQMRYSSYQTSDARQNAQGIFQMQQRSVMQQMLLIPFNQLGKYKNYLNGMNLEQSKALNYFIQNRNNFEQVYGIKIKYLNPEYCFAIDEDGKVISCNYVPGKDEPDVRVASVIKSVEDEKMVTDNVCGYYEDAYFEAAIEYIEQFNQPMEVDGVVIDANALEEIRNNPGMVTNMGDGKRRKIMERLAAIFQRQKANPNKVKVYVKPNDYKNAAFASKVMIASLASFTIGIFVSLLLFCIIKIFF